MQHAMHVYPWGELVLPRLLDGPGGDRKDLWSFEGVATMRILSVPQAASPSGSVKLCFEYRQLPTVLWEPGRVVFFKVRLTRTREG
jgi:hypothetical protein